MLTPALQAKGFAEKSENPTHGSGWMPSSPIYMEALSRRSGNPPHGSVGMVQVHTAYTRQDEIEANE